MILLFQKKLVCSELSDIKGYYNKKVLATRFFSSGHIRNEMKKNGSPFEKLHQTLESYI